MTFFYQVIQFIIPETPPSLLPRPEHEDSVVWFPHPSGEFTGQSARHAIRTSFPHQSWHSVV